MADDATVTTEETAVLNIPPEVEEKFPEIVELIKGSRSMDADERQYWVDVLPIMSESQVDNLKGILDNEKKQLAEAAAAYSGGMNKAVQNVAKEFDEAAYYEKKRARVEAERLHEEEEEKHEENILAELDNL